MTAFLQENTVALLIVVILWILPWKGYALWTSARRGHKGWFVALLILNTFAILEILYIFHIAKKKPSQVKDDAKGLFEKITG